MHPELHINYLAVLVAVITNFIFGSVWYGPLLGKTWAKEMGLPSNFQPNQKEMFRSMGLMIIGSILTAYVLFYYYKRLESFFLEGWGRSSGLGLRILFWNLYLARLLCSFASQQRRLRK
ncbi:PF08570 family protein [Leptospira interrogans serovar Canicola]|nr:PF08570 family protein [Leptospira interrogans serovar Canicola]